MTDSNEQSGPRIEWRLFELMARQNIRSGSELRRRMEDAGVSLSTAQMNRYIKQPPERLPMDLLRGLVTVLECTTCDLMPVIRDDGNDGIGSESPGKPVRSRQTDTGSDLKPKRRRRPEKKSEEAPAPVRPNESEDMGANDDILGPKVTPIPIGDHRKKD